MMKKVKLFELSVAVLMLLKAESSWFYYRVNDRKKQLWLVLCVLCINVMLWGLNCSSIFVFLVLSLP